VRQSQLRFGADANRGRMAGISISIERGSPSSRSRLLEGDSPGREKRPTSRTLGPGAIRSTACVSRPATVQASGAPVGTGGGRPTPAATGTPPVPTPTAPPGAATPAAATPIAAGGGQPAVIPTATEQADPVLASRARERALPQRSPAPGQAAAELPSVVACQPDHRCSRRVTTAGRAAALPLHEAGREIPHRGTAHPLAAPWAKGRSAVTRRRPVSRRRCTRQASSRPGTPARTAGQGRDPSQARRTGASRTAGSPAGHAVTSARLTKQGSRQHSRPTLAHGITTVPLPTLAIRYWRSATRLPTSPRRRPGVPSLTTGRPGPGQLPPGRAPCPAARDRHPGATAPRPVSRGRA
jgi:hypothetical protein